MIGQVKRRFHREIELMRGLHRLKPVVVVDEAHLLDSEMPEDLLFLLKRLSASASTCNAKYAISTWRRPVNT